MRYPTKALPARSAERPQSRVRGKHDRQKFLDVASKLFARDGYPDVSLEDIASSMNASKGSMGYYWRRKEDFLLEIVRRFSGSIQSELTETRALSLPASQRLLIALRKHVNGILSTRSYAAIFFEQRRFLPTKEQRAMSRFDSFFVSVYREIIEDGIRAGEFDISEPLMATMHILAIANWTYRWFRDDGPISREELVANIGATALNIVQAKNANVQKQSERS
jgi:AcrR family transcriptional regulator